jgi:hypothetical protein
LFNESLRGFHRLHSLKDFERAFFLPKNKTLSLSQISQYFYEYKNQKRSNFSSLKKERRYCGQFFYLFFKYPNVKSSILGCFGEWNGGGGVGNGFWGIKKEWDL